MGEYRKLLVWQKAHALAIDVNRVAKRIRGGANASLRNQMIRAALSVPANIVEGRAQLSENDFLRFLNYALGSAGELDYHLLIAKDIGAISELEYWRVEPSASEVRKMLRGLIKKSLPVTGSMASCYRLRKLLRNGQPVRYWPPAKRLVATDYANFCELLQTGQPSPRTQ